MEPRCFSPAYNRLPGIYRQSARGHYLVWQQNQNILALSPGKTGPETLGNGTYPRVASLRGQGAISVWEADGRIVARKLP